MHSSSGEQGEQNAHNSLGMIKADLTELISLFKVFKSENKARSKLFTFWVEYSSIVTSLLWFLKVERTRNWKLHLFSIAAMVTYFIARDRQKYIPYLPVYLANMQQLELTHLDVYDDFNAGNHSINCTGQPFSQVSTNIALELLINTDSKLKGVVIPILHSPSALEWFFIYYFCFKSPVWAPRWFSYNTKGSSSDKN